MVHTQCADGDEDADRRARGWAWSGALRNMRVSEDEAGVLSEREEVSVSPGRISRRTRT